MVHERLHADDRVVAEVVRLAELPELHADGEQVARHAGGELLRARMQRRVADGLRRGLQDAGGGVLLHQPHQRLQAVAAHHRVGVHDDHVLVVGAPAAAEVGHVAGLLLGAHAAHAVEHVAAAGERVAQVGERGALLGDDGVVLAVRQHEDVERVQRTAALQRRGRGAQAGEHGGHVLVADRHDQRGAGVRRQRRVAGIGGRDRVLVPAQQHVEAHQRGEAAGRDPREQQREQGDLQALQHRMLEFALAAGQHHRCERGGHQDQRQQHAATHAHGAFPGHRPGGERGSLGRGLRRRRAKQAVPESAPGARQHRAAHDGGHGGGAGRSVHRGGMTCVHVSLRMSLPC